MTHDAMFWTGAVFVLVGFVLNFLSGRWVSLAANVSSAIGLVFVGFSSEDEFTRRFSWGLAVGIMLAWTVAWVVSPLVRRRLKRGKA